MKHLAKFALAGLLIAALSLGSVISVMAIDMTEEDIKVTDDSTSVYSYVYDFSQVGAGAPIKDNRCLSFGPAIGSGTNVKYAFTNKMEIAPGSFSDQIKFSINDTTLKDDKNDKVFSYTYLAGSEEYRNSEVRINPADLIQKVEIDGNGFKRTSVDFDYLRFDFDLYLKNTESNFYLRLSNTPEAILMLIEPQRNENGVLADVYKIYLRNAAGGVSTDVDKNNDIEIGTVDADKWNTFSVSFFPLRNRIGYYDFSISLNGTELSDAGTMFYTSSIVDDAAFNNADTRLTLGMKSFVSELEQDMIWAVDNIGFELFKYNSEAAETDSIPTVSTVANEAYTELWSSSDISSDVVFNIRPAMTLMNSNRALQFNGVAGSGADLPQWQVKGGYTSSDFSVVASDNGTVSVKKAAGGTVTLPLYGGNLGNANISGVIGDDYKICFAVENALEKPVTLTLNGTSLNLPAFTSGINEVAIVVTGGTSASVSVGDGEAVTTAITKKTAQETPTLVIGLSDNREMVFSGFSVSEKRIINTYTIEIDGSAVEISAVRANYLQYIKAKREAADPDTVEAVAYETLDRRAVRPVGDVIFDSSTYYYAEGAVTVANKWGTSINNAWTTDVTYWGTNVPTPDTEKNEDGTDKLDENGNTIPIEGTETNPLLIKPTPWTEIYLEDGAVVTRINKSTDTEKGWYYTAGFQANLMQENGVKDMLTANVPEYFRYTFSIWYDEVTFPHGTDDKGTEREFTIRMGSKGKADKGETVGDFGLLGQLMFSINGDGILTIPKSTVASTGTTLGYGTNLMENGDGTYTMTVLSEDVTIDLETGWNTIEMLYLYRGSEAKVEDVTGNAEEGTITENKEIKHNYFEASFIVNGDPLYYDSTDPLNTTKFIFDNGKNPCSENVYLEGVAPLFSDGTEKATELMRLKVKDFKLEAISDREVDVNCYIKGAFGDEVLDYTDFYGKPDGLEDEEETRYEHYSEPSVYANAADTVSFVNENDRLVVTHKAADSIAQIGYFYENNILSEKSLAFDINLYADGHLPDTVQMKADNTTLVSISADGVVSVLGAKVGTLKEVGWNLLSAVLEEIDTRTCLTVYLQGEIVVFRAEIALEEVKSLYVESSGNADASYLLDDMAVAQDYVPTSIVYMLPVIFVNDGEISGGSYEEIHVIGTENTLFPTAAKEGASFDGWYFDTAFTAKANRIKKSYTKPVVLYAKYKYRVTYEGYPVNDESTYGEITLPELTDVSYWHANIDGQDFYYAPGSLFDLTENVAFDALDETEAKNIDFILSVQKITLDASGNLSMLYEDVLKLIEGVADDPETKDIDETVIGADQYYIEADKTDAGVIAAKAKLDVIKEKMQDKLDAAAAYLAEFDILLDKSKSYAERYASYEKLNVTEDADGKTWRQRVDSTCPGVFEANNEFAAVRLSFERARKAAVDLAVVLQETYGTSLSEKYEGINKIYKAYIYCSQNADIELVRTYVFTSDDFTGTSVTSPKTSAEYLTSAKQKIDGYHTTVSAYNGEIYSAQAAVNAVVYKAKPVVCIKEVLNRFKEAIAFKHDED